MTVSMWPVATGPKAELALMLRCLEELGGQLAALREIATFATTHVTPLDETDFDQRISASTEGSLDGLSDEDRGRVLAQGLTWIEQMRGLPQDQFGVAFGLPLASAEGHQAAAGAERAFQALVEAYPDADHAGEFVLGTMDAFIAVRRAEVLNRAIVIAAVSSFEQVIRSLVVARLRRTTSDANQVAVLKATRKVLRPGFHSWDQWCQANLGFRLREQVEAHDELAEVFARRHLLVHNAALVDDRYVAAVADAPAIGREVETSASYVRRALDLLVVAGLRAAALGWIRIEPELTHAASVLTHHAARRHLLERGAWDAAAELYGWLAEHADDAPSRALAFVHRSFARKQSGGVKAVRDELVAWSPPGADFELARLVLLDQHAAAHELVHQLLVRGELTHRDLRASPVLRVLLKDLGPEPADSDSL